MEFCVTPIWKGSTATRAYIEINNKRIGKSMPDKIAVEIVWWLEKHVETIKFKKKMK